MIHKEEKTMIVIIIIQKVYLYEYEYFCESAYRQPSFRGVTGALVTDILSVHILFSIGNYHKGTGDLHTGWNSHAKSDVASPGM